MDNMKDLDSCRIINYEKIHNLIETRKRLFPTENIEISSYDHKINTVKTNIDDMKNHIMTVAKNFPHKKCIIAYSVGDEKISLEIHPVVSSA